MANMTNQKVFEIVVKHLRAQGVRSEVSGLPICQCRYKTQTGLKCAIGCLIEDSEYDPKMEGLGVYYIKNRFKVKAVQGININLLERLQEIHDMCETDTWESAFKQVAKEFKLVMPKKETKNKTKRVIENRKNGMGSRGTA